MVLSTCNAVLPTQSYDVQEEVQARAAAAEAHAPTKEHEEVVLPKAAKVHGKVVQTDALQLSSVE